MRDRKLFKWAFTASGLWLILSPFLLLGGQSALNNSAIGNAGLLIVSGLLALIIAGYGFNKHYLVQVYLGVSYGLILVAAPWIFGLTEILTAWNTGITGMILVLVAVFELYNNFPKQRA